MADQEPLRTPGTVAAQPRMAVSGQKSAFARDERQSQVYGFYESERTRRLGINGSGLAGGVHIAPRQRFDCSD